MKKIGSLKSDTFKSNSLKGNYLNFKDDCLITGTKIKKLKKSIKSIKSIKPFSVIRIIASLAVIAVAAVAFTPLETCSAGSDANVVMEVKAGFDGTARMGCYVPYRILLMNKGRTVNGEVQIEIKIDSEHKSIISRPVSLPEGSVKEVVINAPVLNTRRGGKIRLIEGNKTIKEIEYSFTKLIPPEMKIIGVLSSDNSAYGFLSGALIPQYVNPMATQEELIRTKLIIAAGGYSTSSAVQIPGDIQGDIVKVESTLIYLDNQSLPEDMNVMRSFDVLIISNFDTSTLSGLQLETIEKWVEEGGTLVIGSGHNWKKVYNSLPQSLKKFTVTGTVSINELGELEKFAGGADFDSDASLAAVTGNIGFKYENPIEEQVVGSLPGEHGRGGQPPDPGMEGQLEEYGTGEGEKTVGQVRFSPDINEVLVGSGEQPLAVKYIHGSGRILFLSFDPGMEPVAGWKGRQAFWENLLFHGSANSTNRNIFERGSGYYYSGYSSMYYNSLVEQVPEDRRIPFKLVFIAIGAYIVIVGPFLYLYLKRKGKREMNWIAIPAAALLCTFVIYLAGFRTRYKAAVLNAVSIINLDMENEKVQITTGMGIFNNKRGDMKLTYPGEDGFEFDITQLENRSYVVYSDGREPEGKVVSKILLSDPVIYELYDVSMWEPKYISARKSEDLENTIISSVNISNGRIRAVINNTTKYDFMEAFITIGSNFISAGDIPAGQEKVIDVDLNSEKVYGSLTQYLDTQYGRTSYPTNAKVPEDFPEKYRKRRAVESLLSPQYNAIKGQARIGLYALNYQDLGYDVKINGQEPVKYHTNGIFSSLEMSFEKGQEFDIPAGIILPQLSQESINKDIVSVDSDLGMRIRGTGDIDFIYEIPENLHPEEFSLKFYTYVPIYVKYNIEDMKEKNKNFQETILQNKYEYYLYNNSLGIWERIGENHLQFGNTEQYVDKNNCLKVRIRVVEMGSVNPFSSYDYVELERHAFPALQLKGVAE